MDTDTVTKVATAVAGVLAKIAPDRLVSGDKQEQANSVLDQAVDAEKAKRGGDGSPVRQKNFYWDQIAQVLVSAILGLSFLDISIEFFRGSELQCYFELDNFTISKGNYINSYCYGSLPSTQYYLVFILVSALIIIAPHYLWSAYFAAHFDFFFDLIKKLDRLRDINTGEYDPLNFERVKKLEEKYSKSRIFRFYKLKLVLQLTISCVALIVNATYFRMEGFDENFLCPRNYVFASSNSTNPAEPNCSELCWPLNKQVMCVYNSLRLLRFLYYAQYVLLGLTILVFITGLVWICSRHATELGAKKIAKFCFASCLDPEAFSFASWKVLLTCYYCGRQRLKLSGTRHSSEKSPGKFFFSLSCFNPRIKNDLDFLLMCLFMADSGHGQVFKDIQIVKYLRKKVSVDHERLYLFNNIHKDWLIRRINDRLEARRIGGQPSIPAHPDSTWKSAKDIKDHFYTSNFHAESGNPEIELYERFKDKLGTRWTVKPSIRDVVYGFFGFAPNNKLAMDVSFGTNTGFSLVLARAFFDVATIHFNRFYKNPKKICRVDKYQDNYLTITLQDDIFSQTAEAITASEKYIDKLFSTQDSRSLDLIVIGPIRSKSKIDTTNLLIEKMYFKKYFTKGAVLLSVRPLWIGSHNRVTHYCQFKPRQGLFKDKNEEVEVKLRAANVDIYCVEPGKEPYVTVSHAKRHHIGDTDEKTLPARGIVVVCDNVECIFEFRLFQYMGDHVAPSSFVPDNEVTSPSNVTSPLNGASFANKEQEPETFV